MSINSLVTAAGAGNISEVTRLLNDGVAIDGLHSSSSWTALKYASYNGHDAVARLLLARGAHVNLAGETDGWTALMDTCVSGRVSTITLLLKCGADHGPQSKTGDTALHIACMHGHVAVAELLLRKGASHICQNQAGQMPVDRCGDTEKRVAIQAFVASFPPAPSAAAALALFPAPPTPPTLAPFAAVQIESSVDMNSIQRQLADGTDECDRLTAQVAQLIAERDVANLQRDAAVVDRNAVKAQQDSEREKLVVQLEVTLTERSKMHTQQADFNLRMADIVTQKEAAVRDRNNIKCQLSLRTAERDELLTQRDAALVDRDNISLQLAARTNELEDRARELAAMAKERDAAIADRTRITAILTERTQERDAARAERNQLRAQATAASKGSGDLCPFVRYRPHVYSPGVLPRDRIASPCVVELPSTSSLFTFARQLTLTGGAWCFGAHREVAGFRLAKVNAVICAEYLVTEYTARQARMNALRATGGAYFNQRDLNAEQLRILNTLRSMFYERAPGPASTDRTVNTVYCYHGPRRENLLSICSNGMVAVGGLDAGYFGVGCYTTLNIEYAARYAYGDFDVDASGFPLGPRASEDGLYPIIMFAATVGLAYPVTREVDYAPGESRSQLFGKPFKRGFDAHVACVSQMVGYQAVGRDQCEYVELVFEQQAQLLPLAVLWFEKTN